MLGTLTEFEAVTLGDAAEDFVIAGASLLTRLPRGQVPFDVYRIVMKFKQSTEQSGTDGFSIRRFHKHLGHMACAANAQNMPPCRTCVDHVLGTDIHLNTVPHAHGGGEKKRVALQETRHVKRDLSNARHPNPRRDAQ